MYIIILFFYIYINPKYVMFIYAEKRNVQIMNNQNVQIMDNQKLYLFCLSLFLSSYFEWITKWMMNFHSILIPWKTKIFPLFLYWLIYWVYTLIQYKIIRFFCFGQQEFQKNIFLNFYIKLNFIYCLQSNNITDMKFIYFYCGKTCKSKHIKQKSHDCRNSFQNNASKSIKFKTFGTK